jgi:CubicO group peptidase (beta-lactamase class C family)
MKRNTFKMFVTVLVIWALASFTFAQMDVAQVNGKRCGHVQQLINNYFRQLNAEGTFSGSVLIEKDGKVIFKKGYGKSNYEKGKANNPETVFNIASMTKAFTAMCILILEERGLLSVNDTVDQFVPEFPNGNLITLHHLLTHTSGIFSYVNDPIDGIEINNWKNADKFHTPDDLMAYFMYKPFYFAPGSDWSYSNSGYVLLGIIIERVSGMSYGDFLKANIFRPLKMRHSYYDPYGTVYEHKKAIGYDNITTNPPIPAIYWSPSVIYSAGGIYTTVNDLRKWGKALTTPGLLVSEETLEKMFTPIQGYIFDYAYAWFIFEELYTGEAYKQIWHGGAMPGYHSVITIFPEENLTFIILENLPAPTYDPCTFDLKIIPDKLFLVIKENL